MTDPRADWLAERRTGIGSSDAAAILGLSGWSSPLKVWAEKTGQIQPKDPALYLRVRTAMEPVVASLYVERTAGAVRRPQPTISRHPKHEWLISSVDRERVDDPTRKVELKTALFLDNDEWGADGTERVPEEYIVQAQHQMATTEAEHVDIAALFGLGTDFRIYPIARDEAMIELMIETLAEWWEKYVVRNTRPPTDHTDATKRTLAQLYPVDCDPPRVATLEEVGYALALKDAIDAEKQAAERLAGTENAIKACIGNAAKLVGDGFELSWKLQKETQVKAYTRKAHRRFTKKWL